MIFNAGTMNSPKIEAFRDVLMKYSEFNPLDLDSFPVSSGVSDQPRSYEETRKGAENRAKNAFNLAPCNYGLGYESGSIDSPIGRVDRGVCAIYDGRRFYYGDSYGFLIPESLVEIMDRGGVDLSEAVKISGLSSSRKIGEEGGIISILSKGRVKRIEQVKSAVEMAVIHLTGSEFYR